MATVLLSHAGDGAVKTIWPWYDVDAESCWRRCCRVMLVMTLPVRLSRDAL
jgi:hypothetical protein